MSKPTPSPDPRLAQALDAAERRLAMLERLAEMGMAVATTLAEAVVEFPHRPGSGPQGARAYAQAARAVRLTLMLAARVETSILAMRKGELGLAAALDAREAADPPATRAERLRAAVTPAIDREAADAAEAEVLRRRLDARLCERDDDHALLSRPFDDCVTAICADLGLDPEPILAMEGGALGGRSSRPNPTSPTSPTLLFPGEGRGPGHRAIFAEVLDST